MIKRLSTKTGVDDPYLYITLDHLEQKSYRLPDDAQDRSEHPLRFMAYDDDGHLYYEGVCRTPELAIDRDPDYWEDEEDYLSSIYDYFMFDSGCTRVIYWDRATGKGLTQLEVG